MGNSKFKKSEYWVDLMKEFSTYHHRILTDEEVDYLENSLFIRKLLWLSEWDQDKHILGTKNYNESKDNKSVIMPNNNRSEIIHTIRKILSTDNKKVKLVIDSNNFWNGTAKFILNNNEEPIYCLDQKGRPFYTRIFKVAITDKGLAHMYPVKE